MIPSLPPDEGVRPTALDPDSMKDLIPGWVDGFFEIRADGMGSLSEDARRLLGWPPPAMALPWRSRIHPADVAGAERALARLQTGDVERLSFECRLRTGDGDWKALLLCGNREGDSIKGFVIDLSRLPISQIRFRQTLELLDDFVSLHVDDFRPIYVTPALTRLTGITPETAASAADMSWVHPEDRRHVMQVRAQIRRRGDATLRWRLRCADGGWRWLETRCRQMDDPSWRPARYLCTSRDVHDGVEAATRAQWQARHDPLTDLPNRNYFLERASLAIDRLRPGRVLGILFLDLDGFKQINDTLGHAVGDALLRAAAGRMHDMVRGGDVVARMGGDEFTVLLTRLSSAEEAVGIARRLLATLSKPFSIGDRDLFVTASIGASFYPVDANTAEHLLRQADLAMYQAKRHGNRLCLFEPSLHVAARERMRIEHLVRRGIERKEFELHYQPQVSLATGDIQSIEALLRWRQPSGEESVPPAKLVAHAERIGLMESLGRWVLETGIDQLAAWGAKIPPQVRLSFNLSAVQLGSTDLVRGLTLALDRAGVPPERIELEITESAALTRDTHAVENLKLLRGHGIRIALDDFGRGFASLALLRELPLDTVKIDAAFLGEIASEPKQRAILRSVIELAHALELGVVAEGVERSEQGDTLRELGCDAVQGYLITPPVPATRVPELFGMGARRLA